MATQTALSNAIQRRAALLRALGLVTLLMVLTGFGGALLTEARRIQLQLSAGDRLAALDSFTLLKSQRGSLFQRLSLLEDRYTAIMDLDKQWEDNQKKGTGSELKRQIEPLEKNMADLVDGLAMEKSNPLALRAAKAYDNLLIARGMIWRLRIAEPPPPYDPERGQANMQVMMLRQEAHSIASALDEEARDLENARLRGIICSKKEAKEKITKVVSQLRALANRLRSL